MKNVKMKVEGSTMTIVIDLTQDYGPSASGKTVIIASTEGPEVVTFGEGKTAKVNLSVFRAPKS